MSDDPRENVVTDQRPWGDFRQLSHNALSTVKIISVSPGHRLSLQRHRMRGELWQILDVPLQVTVGKTSWEALPGEMVWIPAGTVHRVTNESNLPGRLLEVAFGSFDESDIERLEDDYDRLR